MQTKANGTPKAEIMKKTSEIKMDVLGKKREISSTLVTF